MQALEKIVAEGGHCNGGLSLALQWIFVSLRVKVPVFWERLVRQRWDFCPVAAGISEPPQRGLGLSSGLSGVCFPIAVA